MTVKLKNGDDRHKFWGSDLGGNMALQLPPPPAQPPKPNENPFVTRAADAGAARPKRSGDKRPASLCRVRYKCNGLVPGCTSRVSYTKCRPLSSDPGKFTTVYLETRHADCSHDQRITVPQ